ncbi:MAG: Oligopeptide transport system permease protein OppB [uncultured Rubrobacteraceae bacterium]|uniref:Oligopeptide transport system permease protein OppB n=1 Tax=uncultured Rubrobacteraceae bacterium TaxID=349277 RepID=A0A6J4QQC1_9ACTN|nr:MAG: Oligopeptide transport system permease protein OppB [uncultured Rubrobacteraceae bacterium]
MLAYIVRKVLFSIVVLFVASAVIFVLVSLSGDPLAELRTNPNVQQADIERLTAQYGLDQPLPVQYVIWLGDLLHGDLGTSFKQYASVNSIIAPRIIPTFLLVGSALAVTAILAIPFGVYSAIKKYTLADNVGTFLSFLGFSMPIFWLGLLLQLVLGIYLAAWAGTRIFFVSGMTAVGDTGPIDLLQHLALPVTALAVIEVATLSRFQRSAMLDVMSSDYLRTARAKGLSQWTVYLKHALRNAMIPSVTLLALKVGLIFNGAVITESVFAWPGLGFLLVDSLNKGDYNVARGILIISAALIVVFNLVADLAYSLVDPRVSYD